MGLTDSIHRKNKSEEENHKDFYQTPYIVTMALVGGLKDLGLLSNSMKDMARVLDPCSGLGAIGKIVKKHFKNVIEYDLYSGYTFTRDFLTEEGKYDIIIMNPPYSQKNNFIDKTIQIGRFSFVLMPANVENYTIMNEKYFSSDKYIGKIKAFPKMFMTEELNENLSVKFGGMSAYCWYCFSTDPDMQRKYHIQKFEIIKDVRKYLTK